jgi:hypothetical protein
VAEAVTQELDRTNHMAHHDQCDLCRIVEIINQHNLRFAFTGDSMMSQNVDGFLCELSRRGYNVTEVNREAIDPRTMVGLKEIWTYEVSGPHHWQQPTNVSFVFQYRPHMWEMQHIAVSYDVLVMNFGLHYGYERDGHGRDKEGYENVMANIFNVTSQGNITLLAHRETSAQHHNYSGGEWPKDGHRTKCVSHSLNDSHIIGWRERVVQAKAKELGYKVVVADDRFPLANDKPVAGQRELVILPFFNLTAKLHYFHPSECTHYCSSPYLWMPIWRSLRLAMDRLWSV